MDLIRSESNLEKLPDIFLKHGFKKEFFPYSSDVEEHFEILRKKAMELNFDLPNDYEKFFTIFHNLGCSDFDAAYLYDINLTPIALNGNPKLENIVGFAKDLTSSITGNNLIVFYENDRFAIPKISLYREGEIVRESAHAGNEKYREDYWKDDEIKINKRGKKIAKMLSGVFREIIIP